MSTQHTSNTSDRRRDPLLELVDIDSLHTAHYLQQSITPEVAATWDSDVAQLGPEPIGRARFERTRQLATFLVPATLLYLAFFVLPALAPVATGFALAAAALQVPVVALHYAAGTLTFFGALALGLKLDAWLSRDISRAEWALTEAKRRHEYVRLLCKRLGLQSADITRERISKMAADYQREHARLSNWYEARYSEAAIQAAARAAHERYQGKARRPAFAGAGATALAAGAHAAMLDYVDPATGEILPESPFGYEPEPLYPDVNPASGLPMIDRVSPLDVGGNVYGSSDNNFGF